MLKHLQRQAKKAPAPPPIAQTKAPAAKAAAPATPASQPAKAPVAASQAKSQPAIPTLNVLALTPLLLRSLSDATPESAAHYLNVNGWPTPHGKRWDAASVKFYSTH